jgi:hypothetical protein
MSVNDIADELEEVALRAALIAKAVRPCLRHKDVLIYVGDNDADRHAYALATNMWKAGETVSDRPEVTEAVKDVLDQAADGSCPQCDYEMSL